MSGTSIPLAVQPPSVLDALSKWQSIQSGNQQMGLTAAQTGLTQAQTQGAELQNQQTSARLGLFNQAMGTPPAAGPPGAGGSALLPGGGGAGQPPASALLPGQTGADGTPPPGQLQLPPPVSPAGATMTPFGVPVPRAVAASAWLTPDPVATMAKGLQMGHDYMAQRLTAAGDPNDPDPAAAAHAAQSIRDAASEFYADGWIKPDLYQHLSQNPGFAKTFAASMADPNSQLNAALKYAADGMNPPDAHGQITPNAGAIGTMALKAGAVSGAEASAKVGPALQQKQGELNITNAGSLTTIPVRNADGTYSEKTVPISEALHAAGGSPNAASLINGQQPAAPSSSPYATWAQQHEAPAGGAQTNPGSTAQGPHQFTQGTWQQTMSSAAPTAVAGKTPAQVLAMRNNPAWSSAMADAYGDQNAAAMQKAAIPGSIAPNGQPYNAVVGIAHAFGPDGAQQILQSPPNTPLTQIFPPTRGPNGPVPNPVIAANPSYATMTAGDVVGRYNDAFGKQPYAATPAPGAGVTGAPKPTATQQAGIDVDKATLEKDATTVAEAQTGAMRAQSAMPVLYDLRAKIPNVASGAFGTERAAIGNFMATFGPEWSQKFLAATTGLDSSKASDQQEFIKQAFSQVTSAESQLGGARIGAMLTTYFSKAMPNINMQPGAIKDMTNFLLIGNQMARDYAEGAASHYNASRDAFRADPIGNPYQPLTKFDQAWEAPRATSAPPVYEAAALLLNGRAYGTVSKGLTPEQMAEAYRIATRADPTVRFAGSQVPAAPQAQ